MAAGFAEYTIAGTEFSGIQKGKFLLSTFFVITFGEFGEFGD